ncbi:hypothetical protein [Roseateles aquae]|nr:hypothetical protein [Paucibacter sp. APW11]
MNYATKTFLTAVLAVTGAVFSALFLAEQADLEQAQRLQLSQPAGHQAQQLGRQTAASGAINS